MSAQKKAFTDLIDTILTDCKKPQDLVGKHGLLEQLSQAMPERTMHSENGQATISPTRKFDHD